MSRIYISLPSGRMITLAEFLRAWRFLKSADASELKALRVPFFSERGRVASHAAVKRWIDARLFARINSHMPSYGCGRKWTQRWQSLAQQTARFANHTDADLTIAPRELHHRLSHRIRHR